MNYFFVDVNIPVLDDLDKAMEASTEIQNEVGSCDTGLGFGWRDMQIECADEADQQRVLEIVKKTLTDYGYPFTTGDDIEILTAHVEATVRATVTSRSGNLDDDEKDYENMGLIPPGVQE